MNSSNQIASSDVTKLVTLRNRVVVPSMLTLSAAGLDSTSVYWYFSRRERIKMNAVAIGSIIKNGLSILPPHTEYFHLFNVWGTGYYHWLTEIAPKFLKFEPEIQRGTTLVPRNLPRYILEFFDIFGFDRVLPVRSCFFLRNLNVITNPTAGHHDQGYIGRMRDRIFDALEIKASEEKAKIYVSRRRAARRKVVNDDEVSTRLQDLGFMSIDLEDVSFANQARLFAQCEVFVTIHGAAISNCVFMPPGSKVIELYPAPSSDQNFINPCFENLCSAVGLRHQYLLSKRARPLDQFDFHSDDIIVDIDQLLRAV